MFNSAGVSQQKDVIAKSRGYALAQARSPLSFSERDLGVEPNVLSV